MRKAIGAAIFIIIVFGVTAVLHWRQRITGNSLSDLSTGSLEKQDVATETINNFTFSCPRTTASLSKSLAWEGIPCPREMVVSFSEKGDQGVAEVYLATSPSTPCMSFNPTAKVLADYETGYRTNDFEEMIHSQKSVFINGFPMLRQIYSQGYWTDYGSGTGSKVFDVTRENSVDHHLRYVFFDGSRFVIITGGTASEPYIDEIARSIRRYH
jgi:hypothetical protein